MAVDQNSLMNSLVNNDGSTKKNRSDFSTAMQKMGFTSVFDIVRLPKAAFVRQLSRYSDADAGLAYDNAMGYAALIARLYREHKTSSGKFQPLAQRSGIHALVPLGPTFPNLFKENWDEFCKVGALAALDSPVAYLSALRVFIQQLEATSTDTRRLLLDRRRPDLKDLLITQESTFTPRPMLEIVNEVLGKNLRSYLNGNDADKTKSTHEVLAGRRYPFELPYNFYHQQCQLGLSDKKPRLGELNYRASLLLPIEQKATNGYGQLQYPVLQAQRLLSGLSPQQQALLIEPSVFSNFYLTRNDLIKGWRSAGTTHLNPHTALRTCFLLLSGQADNRQFFAFTVAGQLRDVRLQLAADTAAKPLVSAIQYNAQGQTVRETAGNGVISRLDYAAEDGRLTRLHSQRGSDVLQDLRYAYDPVGNVLSIEDAALPIRYFANQRIEPVNRYVYDSLDQLIKATGWEAGGILQGPAFSRFDDPLTFANYSQTYRYDRGGNLLELSHQGPQSHGHRLVAAPHGNRCLPVRNGIEPDEKDFEKGFDANGNLLNLQPGQTLHWDTRNQLCEVRPVKRDASVDDCERYVYAADGSRVRKVRQAQTNARTLISQTRYLPNLEIRTHSGTGEVVQVIIVQAGRNSVRVLHWESEPPKGVANDQHRYSLDDHLGSCSLELDSTGQVISQERYHPFGTTAWFAGRAEVEASYKTVRYSGKERDATGLYYYGFRYYVGWWQRWLNPDPAGDSDGLNLYDFCANNPIGRIDPDGRMWDDAMELDQALEQFLDNEPGLRADYGLPPFILRSDDASDDEPMDYQPSYNSPQGDESPSDSNPGTPGSPGSPAPPTSDQNTALVVLNKPEPSLGFDLNNRNLFERSNFSGMVYRADRRKPDDVARDGFNPSDEFTAVPKMIGGPALIVADGVKGAIDYAAQSSHTYYFYAIDATGVRGASLMENHVMNYPVMIKHLDAYPDVSPSNQTGGANSMFEAHLNHDDLVGRRIVSLGTLKDEVQRARR